MSISEHSDDSFPPGLAGRLNPVCDRFEAQWLAGGAPNLEEFLPLVSEADRPALRRELLELERHYRLRRNQHVTPQDLRERQPNNEERFEAFPGPRAATSDWATTVDPCSGQVADGKPADASHYQFEEEIGHGGMGVVYRGRDGVFGRSLAIKVLAAKHAGNADLWRRFVEEAHLMGQLQHPGIPPVHDLGELRDGRPYFVMKLVQGRTLAAMLKDRSRPQGNLPQLLAIFEQVCRTLAYAHAQGVIHRDLKPANVMVGAFGEVQVMDWGLAKVLPPLVHGSLEKPDSAQPCTIATLAGAPADATATGMALGTPSYGAPEQARGETDQLDERCDVFGLGAILCEILTGLPPFTGRNFAEVTTRARLGQTEQALARLEECAADSDLVQMARRCLATVKEDRPANAEAVSQAMTAYMTGVEKRKKQAELKQKEAEVRLAEEHKRRLVFAAAALALLVGTAVAVWQAVEASIAARNEAVHRQNADNEKTAANIARATADKHAEKSLQQLYAADVRLGAQLFNMGNILDLQAVLDRQRPALPGADRRGFEWWYLAGHAQPRRPVLRFPSEGKPRLLAYSPDGRFLIAGLQDPLGMKSRLQVWDRNTDEVHRKEAVVAVLADGDWQVGLSPDGTRVASLANDPIVACWDVVSGAGKKGLVRARGGRGCLAFTADSRLLAVGTFESGVRFWDWERGKDVFTLPENHVYELAIAGDGQTMVTSRHNLLTWWDLSTRGMVAQCFLPGRIRSLAFSHNSKWLAVLVEGDGVYLGPTAFRRLDRLQPEKSDEPRAVAFTSDDRMLATGGRDGTVQLWDVHSRQMHTSVRWQMLEIGTLAFSPDGKELSVGTVDGLVHRIDAGIRPAYERWHSPGRLTGEGTLALAADGKTLAVAVSPRLLQLFEVPTGKVRMTLDTPEGQVSQMAFSADSRTLATLSPHVLRLWDAGSGQLKRKLALPGTPHFMALSSSGKILALTNTASNSCCSLWDAESGEQRATLPADVQAATSAVAFSPDGNVLATGDTDGAVRLWDVTGVAESDVASKNPSWEPFAKWKQAGPSVSIVFAPDGRALAVSSANDAVHLWQLQGRAAPLAMGKLQFNGEMTSWHGLQFSADGRQLLTVSERQCRVWDIGTRSWHHQLDDGSAACWLHAVLSPDGKSLGTTGNDGCIRWWRLDTFTERSLATGTLWPVRSLAVTPDGRTVISASAVPKRRGITRTRSPIPLPRSLSKDGTMIKHFTPLRNTSDGLMLWESIDGSRKHGLAGPLTMAPADRIALSRNGQTLAAGSCDGSVWLWDMQQPKETTRLFISNQAEAYARRMELARLVDSAETSYSEAVQALDLTPDGRMLAVASTKGKLTFWDVASRTLRHTMQEVKKDVQWVCFSLDGDTLAYNVGGQVRLWDVRAARSAGDLGEVADSLSLCGVFSPDGRLLVSGTSDNGLRTWEMSNRQERPSLVGHLGPVGAVAFAPDGKTLASGSWDRTVRLWNIAAWQEVAILEGHHGSVTCLTFAPDGKMLLSGSDATPGELFCWRAPGESKIIEGCKVTHGHVAPQ